MGGNINYQAFGINPKGKINIGCGWVNGMFAPSNEIIPSGIITRSEAVYFRIIFLLPLSGANKPPSPPFFF